LKAAYRLPKPSLVFVARLYELNRTKKRQMFIHLFAILPSGVKVENMSRNFFEKIRSGTCGVKPLRFRFT
jgi:hypothetical protein